MKQYLVTYLNNLADEKAELKEKIKKVLESFSAPEERENILESYQAEMLHL